MVLKLEPEGKRLHTDELNPRITVFGVGGGGTNAVDNMIQSNLQGVEFVVANTDAQQLMHSRADRRIQLGPHLTQGLGAGAKPEIGRAAAEEAGDELSRHLDGAHMVFITAGMGGGTGTGAAPVIARMARDRGILTVGVVTKPFTFEGARRTRSAEQGIAELQQFVDTLIVIPNQNLFRIANERTSWKEAFKMADHVLYMGVRGVTDLMVAPGLVNLDFADIRTVMAEMGKAMMGTGEADGENRAIRAAEAAINNPLLEDTSMSGARGLLINITGGDDMTLYEVDQAANRIREEVADDANIIFGSAIDETLTGRVRVSVVATGIDTPAATEQPRPRVVAVGANGVPMPPAPMPTAPSPNAVAPHNPGLGGQGGSAPAQQAPVASPLGAPQLGVAQLPQQVPQAQQNTAHHGQAHQGQAPGMQSHIIPAMVETVPAPSPYSAPVQRNFGGQPQYQQATHNQPQHHQQQPQMSAAPLTVHPVAVNVATQQRPVAAQQPPQQQAPARSPLFAAPVSSQQPVAQQTAPQPGTARNLFGIVTGALRRAAPAPVQQQPQYDNRGYNGQQGGGYGGQQQQPHDQQQQQHHQQQPQEQQGQATDEGLDIPAFLRRQSS